MMETLHAGYARIVGTLCNHRNHERKTTSWDTCRGGYGGDGSAAVDQSVAEDLTEQSQRHGGFTHRPLDRVANNDWEPSPLPGDPRPRDLQRNNTLPNAAGVGCDPRDMLNSGEEYCRFSAFSSGGWLRSVLSPQGWTAMAQEDFGLSLIHAFGPKGKAAKWFAVFSDSSCCVHSSRRTQANTPFDMVDDLCNHYRRISIGRQSHLDVVPMMVPYPTLYKYEMGATMETLSSWVRDEMFMWALPYDDYLMYWRSKDIPVGEGLPPLPEAWDLESASGLSAWGQPDIGEYRSPQDARTALETARRERCDSLLADTKSANEEGRQVIRWIRERYAALGANNLTRARELDSLLWTFWGDSFPAWLKEKHYNRGVMALIWWSANELVPANEGQQFYDQLKHQARAPVHPTERWIPCNNDGTSSDCPLMLASMQHIYATFYSIGALQSSLARERDLSGR